MNTEEYDLVMPFVTVISKGGPHDDASYTAGYEMGALDAVLSTREDRTVARVIKAENVAQADLIAMKTGYTVHFVEHDVEWSHAVFTRKGQHE